MPEHSRLTFQSLLSPLRSGRGTLDAGAIIFESVQFQPQWVCSILTHAVDEIPSPADIHRRCSHRL